MVFSILIIISFTLI